LHMSSTQVFPASGGSPSAPSLAPFQPSTPPSQRPPTCEQLHWLPPSHLAALLAVIGLPTRNSAPQAPSWTTATHQLPRRGSIARQRSAPPRHRRSLEYNQLTGSLPSSWSAWGSSVQSMCGTQPAAARDLFLRSAAPGCLRPALQHPLPLPARCRSCRRSAATAAEGLASIRG
jgi:hypothetical protein